MRDGFRAYPIMSDPNTVPIPAPDPATPTVAAPAPMNFAAESISVRLAVVCSARDWLTVTGATFAGCAQNADTAGLCHCAMVVLEQFVTMMRVMADILLVKFNKTDLDCKWTTMSAQQLTKIKDERLRG